MIMNYNVVYTINMYISRILNLMNEEDDIQMINDDINNEQDIKINDDNEEDIIDDTRDVNDKQFNSIQ